MPDAPNFAASEKALSKVQKAQDPAAYANIVQALYVSYFGRPADPSGLANFESALLKAGAPTRIDTFADAYASNPAVKALVDSFGSSAESQSLYGGGSATAFVQAVYQNVLNRAPDPDGQAFWVDAVESGKLSEGDAALSIMAGALQNATLQGVQDSLLIENRLAVATYFTDQLTQLNGVSSYAGDGAAQTARAMLGGVTATTGVGAYETGNATSVIVQIIGAGPNLQLFAGNLGGPGTANGAATQARFDDPRAIALSGGIAYVIDYDSNVIRKVTADGTVTTFAGTAYASGSADGTGSEARFDYPRGIAADAQGNVYVADAGNNTVRKITASGLVTTFAGSAGTPGTADGTGSAARFYAPSGIVTDAAGNLYLADSGNGLVRKITPAGVVSTLAAIAGVNFVGVDQSGDLYAATLDTVYRIGATGMATVLAGGTSSNSAVDGSGTAASFANILGFSVGPDGNLYVVDRGALPPLGISLSQADASIRKITPSGVVTTVVGTGANLFYNLNYPLLVGLAIDSKGNFYFCDNWMATLDVVTPSGQVSVLAGSAIADGTVDGTGSAARFSGMDAMTADLQGNVYVVDGGAIRKVTPAGVVTTVAGSQLVVGSADGSGSAASFNQPAGIAADGSGNLLVADYGNCTIRKVTQSGVVSTFAGSTGKCGHMDGVGSAAQFNAPTGIAIDETGVIYVAEAGYVRKIDTSRNVATLAGGNENLANGTGSTAGLSNFPGGIVVDAAGNVYVSEMYGDDIRKISPAGAVTSFAGALPDLSVGVAGGATDGSGTAASFAQPRGMAVDGNGSLYVADSLNNTVRKIAPDGTVSTFVGSSSPSRFGFTPGALPGLLPGGAQPPYTLAVSGSSLYIGCVTGIAVVRNLP